MSQILINKQLNNNENINFHFHANMFESHTHNFYELMIGTDGSAIHTYNNVNYTLKQHEVWLISPNDRHSLKPINDISESRHLNIMISAPHFKTLCSTIDVSFFNYLTTQNNSPITIKLTSHEYKKILNLAFKYQTINNSNYNKKNGLLNCLVLSILQEIYLLHDNNFSETPLWLKKFLNDLNSAEYLEMKPNEIYKLVPYSYSNFEKIFKKHMNMSFVTYLNLNKIEYAKALLKTTDYPIITVANKICMHSLGHFYNVFKENTGLTPLQYRKNFKIVK